MNACVQVDLKSLCHESNLLKYANHLISRATTCKVATSYTSILITSTVDTISKSTSQTDSQYASSLGTWSQTILAISTMSVVIYSHRSDQKQAAKSIASPDVRLELTALGLKVPRANPGNLLKLVRMSSVELYELTIVPAGQKKKACPLPDSNWRPWDICLRSSHSMLTMRPT